MKRKAAVLLSIILILSVILAGCGNGEETAEENNQQGIVGDDGSDQSELVQAGTEEAGGAETGGQGSSIVYMTTDISPEGLMNVYEALNWETEGKVAVKLSTGEPPASNYLKPELIRDLVQTVNGTIVECNTAYGGSRAETAMHYQVAEDHGFTAIADFQILDEDGSMILPVTGGTQLTENYVGAA